MRIYIRTVGENIVTSKDFSNIKEIGEITHYITELEILKQELIKLFLKENEKKK